MIREIATPNGKVLESHEPRVMQAMKPETAYTLRSMLSDVIRGGTGSRAKLAKAEAFGKTGTSNDFIDAWFIGGAPGLTTAVYTGNDNHRTLGRSQTGGIAAAPAWKQFMEFAVQHMRVPEKFAPAPAWVEVDQATICRTTGFLATSGCPAVTLYLPSGKAPASQCPLHGGDYDEASADPNAPRLFLIDQDGDIESESIPDKIEQPLPGLQYRENIPQPEPSPYRHDPSPAEVIEEKYQNLLKQYGID
jgi:penicillin-binding protein 1A